MKLAAAELSLLDQIDARQEELLAELDRLNERVERLLQDCLQTREAERAAAEEPEEAQVASRSR